MEPWQQEDGEDHYHDDEHLAYKVEAQAFNNTALAGLLISKTGEVSFRFLGRGHSRASHPRYQGTCLGHPILISKVKVIIYVRFCYPHLLLRRF
jgi:hypothetical protein